MGPFDLRKFLVENRDSKQPIREFAADADPRLEKIMKAVDTLEDMYLEIEDDPKRKKLGQDLARYVLNQLQDIAEDGDVKYDIGD